MVQRMALASMVAFAGLTCSVASAADPTYRVVVREGAPAPTIANAVIGNIYAACLNQRGDVVFTTTLTGSGAPTSQNVAIFGDFGSGPQLLVREGDAAPGTINGTFVTFYIPTLNDQGNLLFSSSLIGPSIVSGNNTGLWQRVGGAITKIAQEGDVIPLGGGFLFPEFTNSSGELANYVYNNSNQTWFYGRVAGTAVDPILWNGSITTLVTSGDAAPGVSGATLVDGDLLVYGGLTHSGRNVLSAVLTGGGATSANNTALWTRNSAGQYELLVREGETAPGGVSPQSFGSFAGTSYENFDPLPRITDSGVALFPAFVGSSSALFRGTRGNLERIAGNNVAVPDVPNTTFNSLALGCFINAVGQVVYTASISGPPITSNNDVGIWSDVSGSFRLVLRENSLAPGAGGALFASFEHVLLSDSGQIAAVSSLRGGAITSSNDVGLWMTDSNGELRLILREGQTFEVAPGVSRTVRYFGLADEDDFTGSPTALAFTSQSNGPRVLNNRGELLLLVEFTDGTRALVVATLPPTTPCPADLTVDGFVDDSDFVLFARQYAAFDCSDPTMTDACSADLNADGFVDDIDFVVFSQAYEQFACP